MVKRKDSGRRLPSLRQLLERSMSEGQLYLLVAAVLVLANAQLFYGSLKLQTEHVSLWYIPQAFDQFTQEARSAPWSAPLDDVFIHFDFARASARGYPFEWSEGNGYSSGGTSLLYPFVLAFGYLIGFRELDLAHWAAVIGCVCTFSFLWSCRRAFSGLPRLLALLAPAAILSTGVLNWTLFSGMEVAFFLALWGLCFVLWDDLMGAIERDSATPIHSLALGGACALLVGGRPEAAPLVFVFGTWAGISLLRRGRKQGALVCLLLVGVPGALVMGAHMLANHHFTGTASAAGALAKLEMHHPYFTSEQVVDAWLFFFKYQILRVTNYHFSSIPGTGWAIWALALAPLFFEKTRRYAILLWLSILIWIALVSLNGQVRWQNARYTMPAVAWLLLAAALGGASTLAWAFEKGRHAKLKWGATGLVTALCIAFVVGQAQRFREQVWFFGRASRNILEQHVRAGLYLGNAHRPRPERVLVSDAGAIPYMADIGAFDLIGLGGYAGLPISEASRMGVGAAIELIEHMPASDRPDVMALYPSWWGSFPLWFGEQVKEFPVRGNVIAGGRSKVIYEPDWSSLEHSGEPLSMSRTQRVVDSLDVADLLSERAHEATVDRPAQGFVGMKMLPDPRNERSDLWDAGRLLSTGMGLSFFMSEGVLLPARKDRTMLIRVAPARRAKLALEAPGRRTRKIEVEPADGWQELRVPLPKKLTDSPLTLRAIEGDVYLYHVFVIDEGADQVAEDSRTPGEKQVAEDTQVAEETR